MPAAHVAAVRRVLRLVDDYASTGENHLMAWKGGAMTWGDIRRHVQAALKLMPTPR